MNTQNSITKTARNRKGLAALFAFVAALCGTYSAALTLVMGPSLMGLGGVILAGAVCLTAAALIFGATWAMDYIKYDNQLIP